MCKQVVYCYWIVWVCVLCTVLLGILLPCCKLIKTSGVGITWDSHTREGPDLQIGSVGSSVKGISTHLASVSMSHFGSSTAVDVWLYVSPHLEGANWKIFLYCTNRMYYLRNVLRITAGFLGNLYRLFTHNIFNFRLQNMKLYKCYFNNWNWF